MRLTENNYLKKIQTNNFPRLPLEGSIELTYRCNNNCLHCWLRIPANPAQEADELSLDEIRRIVNEAKKNGCRQWSISGGEPMLRPDFPEIFDCITNNSTTYFSLNTNGTLITSKIAGLMKRKGNKMVALYGATAQVHDQITRNPGSFEATMRGFRYLKEANAGFIVQLIPMKDNYHQFKEMIRLAESLSKAYRIGASWLYLSACGSKEKNNEILGQRLSAYEVVQLDKPDLSYDDWFGGQKRSNYCAVKDEEYLLSSCVSYRRGFHVNPYGKMTFCCFIKDPAMYYDLKAGTFADAWDNFIPSLAGKAKVTEEYRNSCGTCELKSECRNCPVYSYLEHGRFDKKVEYLCQIAKENKKFKENWMNNHRRYFKIADITIRVDSDLPITDTTFHPKFKHFETSGPNGDNISIRHHFNLPDLEGKDLGKEFYRKAPWAVYKKDNSWIYLGISPNNSDKNLHRVVVSNNDHSRLRIYNNKEEAFLKGNLHSLTLFPTDQILIARLLADREGCFLHSCGVVLNGQGLLFAGHSEAGKSTMAGMLKGKAEILCDDRIIIRRQTHSAQRTAHSEFRIYGTWSHGDVPDVSANSAPLKAIMFLEKANENRLVKIQDKKEIARRLLSVLIRPFVTNDWWEKSLALVDNICAEVPCYVLKFDKSGKVIRLLEESLDGDFASTEK